MHMVLYLLLALLSGLAPRGVAAVDTLVTEVATADSEIQVADAGLAFVASGDLSELPIWPFEIEEEEETESELTQLRPSAKNCLSLLARFLAPSECVIENPQVLRKPVLLPVFATPRTILHQVFRI